MVPRHEPPFDECVHSVWLCSISIDASCCTHNVASGVCTAHEVVVGVEKRCNKGSAFSLCFHLGLASYVGQWEVAASATSLYLVCCAMFCIWPSKSFLHLLT